MDRDTALSRLRAVETELKARGVVHASLFGSVARGEQSSESDIDIMVDINPTVSMGVYEYVGLVNFIGDIFATKSMSRTARRCGTM